MYVLIRDSENRCLYFLFYLCFYTIFSFVLGRGGGARPYVAFSISKSFLISRYTYPSSDYQAPGSGSALQFDGSQLTMRHRSTQNRPGSLVCCILPKARAVPAAAERVGPSRLAFVGPESRVPSSKSRRSRYSVYNKLHKQVYIRPRWGRVSCGYPTN